MTEGPLDKIRVLDLADEKGEFCSKLLADMGTDVIKVEKPGRGRSREIGPFWKNQPDPEKSIFFWYNNTNKRGITLDLEHEAGREIFSRLIKRTDVLVETFDPGRLEAQGLNFEALSRLNPGLIMVSVTGFGRSGPRSEYKSCDLAASAFGGQMSVTGSPATPPLRAFGEQSYYTASLFAAMGVLLALRGRARTGRGEHIDISLQEAVAATLDHVMVRYFYDKVVAERQGGLHWNNTFCILPCKDGYILLTPLMHWETLVEWMDGEGMAGDLKDEKYGEEEYRLGRIDHVIETLQAWTETHTTDELFELGQLMHFPWAPVQSPRDVGECAQLESRNFFVPVHHPEIGASIEYPGRPYKSSLPFSEELRRPPLIGEHNLEVFQGELGLSDEELERLAAIKVI